MYKTENYIALLKSDTTKHLSPVNLKIVKYGDDVIGCLYKKDLEYYINLFLVYNKNYKKEDFIIGKIEIEKTLKIID